MDRLIILCGPTGVGKTELALDLARELDAEIVSADAGQVYIGFDIGTAKPSPELQAEVPHHCIDLWEPTVQSDAAIWQRAADRAIAEIREKGKRVLVCGGTGFYIKALLHGLFPGPDPEPELRARLQREFEELGGEVLHARLTEIDLEAAVRIHPNDPVRLIRALEVYEMTGKTMSAHQQAHQFEEERYPAVIIGLDRKRETLYERINERVVAMMAAAWIEEARALFDQWGRDVHPFQLIGYREIARFLAGETSEAELVPAIQQASRHYAKRQLTWFRANPAIQWFDVASERDGMAAEIKRLTSKG